MLATPLLMIFVFLKGVRIPTQRAIHIASNRATNLATHLPHNHQSPSTKVKDDLIFQLKNFIICIMVFYEHLGFSKFYAYIFYFRELII
jgi:hypothetical protein